MRGVVWSFLFVVQLACGAHHGDTSSSDRPGTAVLRQNRAFQYLPPGSPFVVTTRSLRVVAVEAAVAKIPGFAGMLDVARAFISPKTVLATLRGLLESGQDGPTWLERGLGSGSTWSNR